MKIKIRERVFHQIEQRQKLLHIKFILAYASALIYYYDNQLGSEMSSSITTAFQPHARVRRSTRLIIQLASHVLKQSRTIYISNHKQKQIHKYIQ